MVEFHARSWSKSKFQFEIDPKRVHSYTSLNFRYQEEKSYLNCKQFYAIENSDNSLS